MKCHGFYRQWSTDQFPPLKLKSTTRARPDPTGPAWTLSETRTDPTEFLGDPGRSGPVGSGRARVVEFSQYQTKSSDFVWSGPVRSGPCSGIRRLRCTMFANTHLLSATAEHDNDHITGQQTFIRREKRNTTTKISHIDIQSLFSRGNAYASAKYIISKGVNG